MMMADGTGTKKNSSKEAGGGKRYKKFIYIQ